MLNKVVLQGRLTADPEVKKTQSGKSVCSFTLAVNRNYGGGVDFFDCVAWVELAELMGRFCHKGDMLVCGGSLLVNKYETKNGLRSKVEVKIDEINFTGKSQKQENENEPFTLDEFEDDFEPLPF